MGNTWLRWARHIELPGPCKSVLTWLADHASDEDGRCWPSQAELARLTGLSVKTVWRCLGRLEKAGLIKRQHQHDRNGHRREDMITLCKQATYRTESPIGAPGLTDSQASPVDSQSGLPVRESTNPSENPNEPSAAAQPELDLGLLAIPAPPAPSLIVRYGSKLRLEKYVPHEFRKVDKRKIAKHWLGTTDDAVAERRKPLFLDALWCFWRQLVDERRPLAEAKAERKAALERIRAGESAVQQVQASPQELPATRRAFPAPRKNVSPRRQGRERSPALARIDAAMRLRETQIEEEESNGPGHNAGGPIIDM